MVHNVVATTFYTIDCVCYQCSCALECSVCQRLEENPWKLPADELRRLRDDLAADQLAAPAHAIGAAICPNCDLLVACPACRLPAPLDVERVDELARQRRNAQTRTAA